VNFDRAISKNIFGKINLPDVFIMPGAERKNSCRNRALPASMR
jgi:hypothetical protein